MGEPGNRLIEFVSDFIQNHKERRLLNAWWNKFNLEVNSNNISFRFVYPEFETLIDKTVKDQFTSIIRMCPGYETASVTFNSYELFPSLTANTDFSFENFYINSENRLALAASRAICKQNRSIHYNPLFIYAETGRGKSHLCNAICLEYSLAIKNSTVRYLNAEMFSSQFYYAVENNKIDTWRNINQSVDLFILEDFHKIKDNINAVDEFFRLFDILHNQKKQIVITSSENINELATIADSYKSRLEWGLAVEISSPKIDTKKQIINDCLEIRGINASKRDIELIAEKCTSGNVRSLIGLVNSICSHVSLLECEINAELIDSVAGNDVTSNINKKTFHSITTDDIKYAVAEFFKINPDMIVSKSRIRSIAYPRQICMFLAKRLTNHSLEEIGGAFGGRDHSTVKHGCEKIKKSIDSDPSVKSVINELETRLSLSTTV